MTDATTDTNFDFSYLDGYVPDPEKTFDGGFEPFKARNLTAKFNYCRVEDNDDDKYPESIGAKFFAYELEILDGDYESRRLWLRVNLSDSDKVKRKIASFLHRMGISMFKNLSELEKICEVLIQTQVKVDTWIWTTDAKKKVQQHKISGEAESVTANKFQVIELGKSSSSDSESVI